LYFESPSGQNHPHELEADTAGRGAGRVSLVVRWVSVAAVAVALLGGGAKRALAFEFFDGRLQAHGFVETRLAFVNDDMSDDTDLAQWANVFNLELEFDVAPDGWGPFLLLQVYSRISVQYDCIYTRACGLFPSADMVGNRANKQPDRLSDGPFQKFTLTSPYTFADPPPELATTTLNQGLITVATRPTNRVSPIFNTEQFRSLFQNSVSGFTNSLNPLEPLPNPCVKEHVNAQGEQVYSDPASYVFDRYCGYGFAGPEFVSDRTSVTGPYLPKNFVHPLGALRNRSHPFNRNDHFQLYDPRLGRVDTFRGGNALPFRPPPTLSIFDPAGTNQEAQGLYVPSVGLRRIIGDIDKGSHDQNFRQEELAWNRGASQQQTKELKELYLDFELFDGALWGRLGKQTIVWGKTELFRNQDRWNPTDIGLGPLASLEESRVSLWSARLIYMLYDVGPLRDVRIETALVMQDFEPFDLGQCGEALLPRAICGVRLGLFGHGFSALGLAGQIRPEDPWDDTSGFEPGIRVEFRWDRFSFAITDYYGYQDTPTPVRYFTYERNVDPVTGRPRQAESRLPCDPGGVGMPGCLGVIDPVTGDVDVAETTAAASSDIPAVRALSPLLNHHANQQLFAQICAGTLGTIPQLIDSTRSTCAQTIFNTEAEFGFRISTLFSNLLAGNARAIELGETALVVFQGLDPLDPFLLPEVVLEDDPCDAYEAEPGGGCPNQIPGNGPALPTPPLTLNQVLTDQQEALLGCGRFYGTDCELDGIDLLNMEASVIFQSWMGFSGTQPGQTTIDGSVQPGTFRLLGPRQADRFDGGPACTRFVREMGTVVLPGCRSPLDEATTGWDPRVDGGTSIAAAFVSGDPSVTPLRHPCAYVVDGQCAQSDDLIFVSEMAALSWNAQMTILVLGALTLQIGETPGIDVFDARNPFRTDGCSLAVPTLCDSVQGFSRWTGNQHPSVRAGGNGRYGRRDFLWHGGSPLVLEYQKNNVLGFAMDFTEDATATSWGVEFSWANDVLRQDNGQFDGLTEVDQYNLTLSVDRPTFVHFLNSNRSLFFNAQLFVGYESGYNRNFPSNGPWNTFGTFTVLTGYLQDRLNPSITTVYDAQSNSGGILPNVQYRFTDNFSVSFGAIFLWGRYQEKPLPISPPSLSNQVEHGPFRAYQQLTEQFIAAARDLDQFTLRIRYTF
jgi:hypothetical protein